LTRDSGILRTEPEVEEDQTESESEGSDNRICCRAENRALVDNSEIMEPESKTDDDNPESESETSGDRVCHQVRNSSEDSEASISELESASDKLDLDFEHFEYKVQSPFGLVFSLPEMIVDGDCCGI